MVDLLLRSDGSLGKKGVEEAALLCTCVFDGDLRLLRRLLRAGAHVDAGDYDKRTALHIAAGAPGAGGLAAATRGSAASRAGASGWSSPPHPLPAQWRATWPPASCW